MYACVCIRVHGGKESTTSLVQTVKAMDCTFNMKGSLGASHLTDACYDIIEKECDFSFHMVYYLCFCALSIQVVRFHNSKIPKYRLNGEMRNNNKM